MEKIIAKIERVSLGYEDHGIFTCYLHLSYGAGGAQGAGGWALDEPLNDENGDFVCRVGTAFGMEFIIRLMRASGVDEWSKLVGRTVYALKDESQGWNGHVKGIAPLPTERGEEFVFSDLFPEMRERGLVREEATS